MFRARQQGPKHLSHWSVLGVIGKVLKRRYRKWPRIGHLDICSPSYWQKKGRESNWQFDSRPLKVKNRPLPDLRIESTTWRWKDLDEGYNCGLDLVAIRLFIRELWALKVLGLQSGQFRDSFGTISGLQLGSFGKKSHLDVTPVERCREYYMGEGGGFPRIRAVVSLVCQSARGLSQHPNTQGSLECELTPVWLVFGCRFRLDLLVPLPSLIPGLLARPSTPL
jgi:hypothetical protein